MTLNIPNLDRLISYLEALPQEAFDMKYLRKASHPCGTACCIQGYADILFPQSADKMDASFEVNFGVTAAQRRAITMPLDWDHKPVLYPLSRALRMLRHLRAEFLRTGTVVVDWDAPEAVETQRKPWAPPVVIGADKPLPAELRRLVREPATATEA